MTVDHASYYQRVQGVPVVRVCIASTNEPNLEVSLQKWASQSFQDFHADVVVDCVEDATWDLARSFVGNGKFTFRLGPHLQGLCAVWNDSIHGLQSEFLCLSGADNEYPMDYLEKCVSVLRKHPEYGWVVPSVRNLPDDTALWSYFISKDCLDKVGGFDPAFGLGGVAMIRDWQTRAYDAGFHGAVLRFVPVGRGGYSLMDKIRPDDAVRVIEGGGAFKEKYGIDLFNTQMLNIRPEPVYVGNDGEPVSRFRDELLPDEGRFADVAQVIQEEIRSLLDAETASLQGKSNEEISRRVGELEKQGVLGLAAVGFLLRFWADNTHVAQDASQMVADLQTAGKAMDRLMLILVKTRLSGLYK